MPLKDNLRKEVASCSLSADHLKQLLELLGSIRYGSVTLVVQDRKVVQIDKNEKVRLG